MSISILDDLNNVLLDDPDNPSEGVGLFGEAEVVVSMTCEAEGAIFVGGEAIPAIAIAYEAHGGFSSGAESPVVSGLDVDVGGPLLLSGAADRTISAEVSLPFKWKVYNTQEVTLDFTWAIGERPFSFYRVLGKCKPATCPPISSPDCDNSDSTFRFMVNIYARNLSEVCQKLRDRYLNFPIESIQKFSRPPSKLDFTDDTDLECNRLEDVTPPLTFLACSDLLVDANLKVSLGMSAKCLKHVADYVAGGSIGFGGEIPLSSFPSYVGSGTSGLSGSAICLLEGASYVHVAEGGLVCDGTAPDARSEWYWEGSGNLGFDGFASITMVDWYWVPTGGLGLSGTFATSTSAQVVASGAIVTLNSTAFSPSDYFPFTHTASGGLSLSGSFAALPGQYVVVSSGSLLLGGLTSFVSSAIATEMAGSLFLLGTSGNNIESGGNGEASFGGSASCSWSPNFIMSGAVSFSGSALVQCSVSESAGGVSFAGETNVECSHAGTKRFNLGMDCEVYSQSVQFSYEAASAIAPVFSNVQTQCCPLTLPQRLRLTHPLGSSNYFSRFLKRNNLSIPTTLDLYYNSREAGWYNTLHFQGFAPDFPTIEQWTVTLGFQCVNSGDATTLPILPTYWRFSMLANLRSLANQSIPQRLTRVVAGFDASLVCFNSKPLNFIFDLDTSKVKTTPTAVQNLAYVDDIGMFKSPVFVANPKIRFKISELAVDIPPVTVDVGPAVTSAQRVAVLISGNKPAGIPI